MPTLAQTIYFEPHGYPGVTVSLDVPDTERVQIQHAKTGPGTPSVITIHSNVFGKEAPVSYDLTEGDAEKIGRWLAAHSRTFDKVIEGGVAKFTRRRAVVYQTNPDTDGPHNSKLAFLTSDNHERRLNAASLQWLALTPIKGSDEITISYIHGQNRQCEHTISATCAQDITRWITFTGVFNRTGYEWDRKPEADMTATQVLNRDAAARIGQQKATAQIDVALEQVILLARECGKSEEFASDIAAPLKLLLRLMIRDAMVEQSRENRDSFLNFTRTQLGQPYDMPTTTVKGGKKYDLGLRPTGVLEPEALACLRDVISHASDFREALATRLLKAQADDREEAPIDAQPVDVPDKEASYWVHQQHVFDRMVEQAKRAIDAHNKVSQ